MTAAIELPGKEDFLLIKVCNSDRRCRVVTKRIRSNHTSAVGSAKSKQRRKYHDKKKGREDFLSERRENRHQIMAEETTRAKTNKTVPKFIDKVVVYRNSDGERYLPHSSNKRKNRLWSTPSTVNEINRVTVTENVERIHTKMVNETHSEKSVSKIHKLLLHSHQRSPLVGSTSDKMDAFILFVLPLTLIVLILTLLLVVFCYRKRQLVKQNVSTQHSKEESLRMRDYSERQSYVTIRNNHLINSNKYKEKRETRKINGKGIIEEENEEEIVFCGYLCEAFCLPDVSYQKHRDVWFSRQPSQSNQYSYHGIEPVFTSHNHRQSPDRAAKHEKHQFFNNSRIFFGNAFKDEKCEYRKKNEESPCKVRNDEEKGRVGNSSAQRSKDSSREFVTEYRNDRTSTSEQRNNSKSR